MKEYVAELRKNQTEAEIKLWYALRNRRFCNFKFRRQKIIGFYIVDFICLKSRLIIEVDGSQHLGNKEYDDMRSDFLESRGYRVLRFWNNQILQDLTSVLETIYLTLAEQPSSGAIAPPSPNLGEG